MIRLAAAAACTVAAAIGWTVVVIASQPSHQVLGRGAIYGGVVLAVASHLACFGFGASEWRRRRRNRSGDGEAGGNSLALSPVQREVVPGNWYGRSPSPTQAEQARTRLAFSRGLQRYASAKKFF